MFGEAVRGKSNTEHREKLALDWSDGLWFGRSTANDDRLILAKDGVIRTQTMRRKPAEQQFEKKLFDQVLGVSARQPARQAELLRS